MERIIVKNLSKKFKIGSTEDQTSTEKFISSFSGRETTRDLWALKNVSFSVKKNEMVSIIGVNGSGKTTLLRTIAGIYKPDGGEIKTFGKIIPIINVLAGLSLRLTLKENIYLQSSFFGLFSKEIKKKYDSIVEFSELEKFVETKVYQFSSGMQQRLALSIALHCNPKILLLDEIFVVGDIKFFKKSLIKIKEILDLGCSSLVVTHDLELAKKFHQRVIWLDQGKIIKEGNPAEVIEKYLEFTKNNNNF